MDETLAGLLGGAGAAASAILPYTMSQEAIDQLKALGTQMGARGPAIGAEAAGATEFEPFTVTTGTGTTAVTPTGGYTQTLAETPAAIEQGLLGAAQAAVPGAQVTPEELYSRIQAMRAPGIERQRGEIEQRLAAQGRLGTSSMLYGGSSPELMALEESLRQQESADLLASLTQAGALTGQNIQNIQGMLTGAYTPQTQALAALTPSVQLQQPIVSSRLGGSEALYKGGIAGLEAEAAGLTGAANLEAARTQALGNTLAQFFGVQMAEGQTQSPYERLLNLLMGGSGSSSPSSSSSLTDSEFFDRYGYFRGEA